MTEAVGARHASPSLLYAQCRGLLIPPGRGMPRPYFCISPFRHSLDFGLLAGDVSGVIILWDGLRKLLGRS